MSDSKGTKRKETTPEKQTEDRVDDHSAKRKKKKELRKKKKRINKNTASAQDLIDIYGQNVLF